MPHISEISVPHSASSLDDIRSDSKGRWRDIFPHQDKCSSDFFVDERPSQPFSQRKLNDLVKKCIKEMVFLLY
jgi:hypothetical protein